MILIVAYGNSLRQDDAAGLALAKIIKQECLARQLPATLQQSQQLLPELAAEMAQPGVEAVVFVDTQAVPPEKSEPVVQIQRIRHKAPSPSLGHHLTPETLLVYARQLYGREPVAWLVTAPGVAFGHGQGLSQVAQLALANARPQVKQLCQHLAAPAEIAPVPIG